MSYTLGQRVRTPDGEGIIEQRGLVGDFPRDREMIKCNGLWWDARQLSSPVDCSWADRVLLITYPELFICEKAGECKEAYCHKEPHAHKWDCEHRCSALGATCIPYVPEDEGNDWVTIYGPAFTKRTKAETERIVKVDPGYRAFKWSDGLKGAPCE